MFSRGLRGGLSQAGLQAPAIAVASKPAQRAADYRNCLQRSRGTLLPAIDDREFPARSGGIVKPEYSGEHTASAYKNGIACLFDF
jgi:hypothetical protein